MARSYVDIGIFMGWSPAKANALVLETCSLLVQRNSHLLRLSREHFGRENIQNYAQAIQVRVVPRCYTNLCNVCALTLQKKYGMSLIIGWTDGSFFPTLRPVSEAAEKRGKGKLQQHLYSGTTRST